MSALQSLITLPSSVRTPVDVNVNPWSGSLVGSYSGPTKMGNFVCMPLSTRPMEGLNGALTLRLANLVQSL
jgi:hypothetical protein